MEILSEKVLKFILRQVQHMYLCGDVDSEDSKEGTFYSYFHVGQNLKGEWAELDSIDKKKNLLLRK